MALGLFKKELLTRSEMGQDCLIVNPNRARQGPDSDAQGIVQRLINLESTANSRLTDYGTLAKMRRGYGATNQDGNTRSPHW
jgi:hypothetical protein